MSLISINLDETPDRIEPVSAGTRTLDVRDMSQEEDKNGDNIITVEFEVNEPDTEEHDRRAWDRFNFKYAPAKVKFKQLCKSAGHTGTGTEVDPSEIIGCTVTAVFKDRTYVDKTTGDTVATTQIQKYLFDA